MSHHSIMHPDRQYTTGTMSTASHAVLRFACFIAVATCIDSCGSALQVSLPAACCLLHAELRCCHCCCCCCCCCSPHSCSATCVSSMSGGRPCTATHPEHVCKLLGGGRGRRGRPRCVEQIASSQGQAAAGVSCVKSWHAASALTVLHQCCIRTAEASAVAVSCCSSR